ncbi:MAG: hypothetical protein J6386_23755 [Candidatus Synoicihabitans palmerolidicus]|nr:hypothetical protein [Candidatus Synoicihabitans palmerolidicus]
MNPLQWLSQQSLKRQLAVLALPPLMILVAVLGTDARRAYLDYRNIEELEKLVELADRFSMVSVALASETDAGMWDMIFAGRENTSDSFDAHRMEFAAAVEVTDWLLAEAREQWELVDPMVVDPETVDWIEQTLADAEALSEWRRVAMARGGGGPETIAKDPYFVSQLVKIQRDTPEQGREQALWDFFKEHAYGRMRVPFNRLLPLTARETVEAELSRRIVVLAQLVEHEAAAKRECELMEYYLQAGTRPNGLYPSEWMWLRELLMVQERTIEVALDMAPTPMRAQIREALSDEALESTLMLREWFDQNWEGHDIHAEVHSEARQRWLLEERPAFALPLLAMIDEDLRREAKAGILHSQRNFRLSLILLGGVLLGGLVVGVPVYRGLIRMLLADMAMLRRGTVAIVKVSRDLYQQESAYRA